MGIKTRPAATGRGCVALVTGRKERAARAHFARCFDGHPKVGWWIFVNQSGEKTLPTELRYASRSASRIKRQQCTRLFAVEHPSRSPLASGCPTMIGVIRIKCGAFGDGRASVQSFIRDIFRRWAHGLTSIP